MILRASIIGMAVLRGGRLLEGHTLGVSSESHFTWLAAAAMSTTRDAITESSAGTAVATAEIGVAVQLLLSLYALRKRAPRTHSSDF